MYAHEQEQGVALHCSPTATVQSLERRVDGLEKGSSLFKSAFPSDDHEAGRLPRVRGRYGPYNGKSPSKEKMKNREKFSEKANRTQ